MPWYKTTLNNKLYILRTADSAATEATRDQVEAWITNLAEPTLSYTRDSDNVTFTLNFTPAPVDIANAVARYKGIQFKVIRHAACGHSHRTSWPLLAKRDKRLNYKQGRGWNYNNWIENYFRPTGYLAKLVDESITNKAGMQILTIPALRANITNITAAELRSGSITRTLPLFKIAWPYVGGALDGSARGTQDGKYEFFVGLLYWRYNPTITGGGNCIPYKFKMCYYSE